MKGQIVEHGENALGAQVRDQRLPSFEGGRSR